MSNLLCAHPRSMVVVEMVRDNRVIMLVLPCHTSANSAVWCWFYCNLSRLLYLTYLSFTMEIEKYVAPNPDRELELQDSGFLKLQ